MSSTESSLVITESNAQQNAIAAIGRIAPQPMKAIKLTSTNAWQYFYLEPVLDATAKSDTDLQGGPLAMLVVETNDVRLDFGLLAEGSASLSDQVYAVGAVGSIPIHVTRIAYKSAVDDSHGVIRFYAPYDKDALAAL